MRGNVITMSLDHGSLKTTSYLYQYDYGQKLVFEGIELPETYEVHFANVVRKNARSLVAIGGPEGVDIPDNVLTNGDPIYLWLFVHTGADDGETVYEGKIPVKEKTKPSDTHPTPVQQDIITQVIALLNSGITRVEDIYNSIQQIIDESLAQAKASGEFDGYSPTVQIDPIDNGVRITITDVNGPHSFDLIGSNNYYTLLNKPSINNVELNGNKSLHDLGAAAESDIPTKVSQLSNDEGYLKQETDPTVPSWAKEPTKPSYTPQEIGAIPSSMKGSPNGVAELDINGKVPSSQLPAYVDDVINGYYYNSKFYKDSEHTIEIVGEGDKIYVDIPNNTTYRWSGSGFVQIKGDLALGETSSTAYRGDHGKVAYDHATDANRVNNSVASGLYKFGVTSEGHIASTTPVTKKDITDLGILSSDDIDDNAGSGDTDKLLSADKVVAELNKKIDKEEFDDAGIKSRTNVPLFGGEFTVVTAVRPDKTTPYCRAGATGRAHKENMHRVVFDNTEYILPVQICFNDSGYFMEYIGNIDICDDYWGADVTLNQKFNVPFFILFDDSDNVKHIDVWTTEAGSHTILVERIDVVKKRIPNELLYKTAYSIIQECNSPGGGADPISIGVNGFGAYNGRTNINGNTSIGHHNIHRGSYSLSMGISNHIEGSVNGAFGFENAILDGGSEPYYSFGIGFYNTVSSARSHAIGSGNHIGVGDINHIFGAYNNIEDNAACSFVLGSYNTVINGIYSSFTLGNNLINGSACTTVLGVSNIPDTNYPAWTAGNYEVGDRVLYGGVGYECITANSDESFDPSKWIIIMHSSPKALILGNGGQSGRSNAFAVDWDGTGHFMGDIYVGCSYDCSGGHKLPIIDDTASSVDKVMSSNKVDSIVDTINKNSLLIDDTIMDTVENYVFDQQTGDIQRVTHTRGNIVIRTDVFTFNDNIITEVRTLNTGESLTIVTNTDTLVTTNTYSGMSA